MRFRQSCASALSAGFVLDQLALRTNQPALITYVYPVRTKVSIYIIDGLTFVLNAQTFVLTVRAFVIFSAQLLSKSARLHSDNTKKSL